MHGGQLLSEGTMEEIQTNERVMEVYLGRQGKEEKEDARTEGARSVV